MLEYLDHRRFQCVDGCCPVVHDHAAMTDRAVRPALRKGYPGDARTDIVGSCQ
jgi:hypothetical protein